MIRVLILILQIALFSRHAWGGVCQSELTTAEIDWTKLHGTWYDVVDIPTFPDMLCWKFTEFHQIDNGVRITSYERGFGHREDSQPTQREFVRINGGLYSQRPLNVTKFNEIIDSALADVDEKDRQKIVRIEEDLQFRHTSFFLTDYKKYFIIVFCLGTGFQAFVKSPTPNVDMEFLNQISEALNEVGLKSPIMTLKTECMQYENRQE